ncbi:isochorismatase family protein [Streptomyces sp. NPDC047082]|uniref:isochorismatase family protein n=1 Tax=Streptomyces sp. NPDC047082 TaxID=3155259 RepID=UPI0033DBE10A
MGRPAGAGGDSGQRAARLTPATSTNLDFILRSKGIDTIILGGFLTNCRVESTMRTGYEHGFRVITLTDCVAATSQEEHDNAISYDFPMFSLPMTAADVIAAL